MEDWKELKIEGISSVERVMDVFQIWSHMFPSRKVKIKIVERTSGGYTGYANIAPRDKYGSADGMSAWGKTPTDALGETVKSLLLNIAQHGAVSEEDFEWSDPNDF